MKYTKSHEWIAQDGKVGISTHAREELGEIVHVELPKIGQNFAAGDVIAVAESTKAAADIHAPVTGTVIAVNSNLEEAVSLLNTDPEGEGWLFTMEVTDQKELDQLLDAENYRAFVG